MTERYFKFVRHEEVGAYESLGWQRTDALDRCHHGAWSNLMRWTGVGAPVLPFRVSHEKPDVIIPRDADEAAE